MSWNRVIRSGLAAAGLVVACAGSVLGQVRVSGIEMMPAGGASLSPMPDGSLLVSNIGSSGQDGVEVGLNSRWGGAVSFALDELLIPSPAAREIRTRPRGWDGTIKGSLRLASRPPDGSPGSSLDLECDFAAVGAATVRVTVRDQFDNVILDGVRAGASVQCVISMSPPAGFVPTCGVAIKTKGTGAENNRVMTVRFDDIFCSVSGLSSATLHEVRSIEISPETCGQCDAWLGTESLLLTGDGVSQCVVSSPRVHTFEVSSSGVGDAFVDEECANPAACDTERRLHVSNIGSSGQDGVAIELGAGSIGAAVTFDCFAGGLLSRPVVMEQSFETSNGTLLPRMRVGRSVDALSGQETIACDASELGATDIDVYCFDISGTMVHSHRAPTAVVAFACTAGTGVRTEETWSCLHHRWVIDMSTPDTLVLVGGVSVPGVSSVSLVPRLALSTVPRAHRMYVFGGQGVSSIDIKHVNDPPTVVRLHGIIAIPMEKGLIAQQPDGSLLVTAPCCDQDDDGDGLDDGVELLYHSTYGGHLRLTIAKLMENSSQNQAIRIRPKGWDGTIKGSIQMSGSEAGGVLHLACDFAEMGAVEMQWVAYGADASVLASGIAPGSSLGCTATPLAGLEIPTCGMAINRKGPPGQHRMGGTVMFEGGPVTLGGLGSVPVQGVSAFGFTPIECGTCTNFADVESMQVTLPNHGVLIQSGPLTILDASVLTFGVEVGGIHDAHVGEVCDVSNSCDDSRKLWIGNLGSTGQDGVQIRLGNPLVNEVAIGLVDGASMNVASGNCCRGHVIIMKAFDDEGQEMMRATRSSDEGGTQHTMEFDGSASGATVVSVTLRDQLGNFVHSHEFGDSIGSISYVAPCDASEGRAASIDSSGMCVELCDGPVTVHIDLLTYPDVRDVCWSLSVAPGGASAVHGVEITGNPTDYIEISNFALIEGEPPCAADFDGDGVRAVPDIFAFLSAWFAQAPAAYNFGGVTGVPAIFAFLSVWFAGCP